MKRRFRSGDALTVQILFVLALVAAFLVTTAPGGGSGGGRGSGGGGGGSSSRSSASSGRGGSGFSRTHVSGRDSGSGGGGSTAINPWAAAGSLGFAAAVLLFVAGSTRYRLVLVAIGLRRSETYLPRLRQIVASSQRFRTPGGRVAVLRDLHSLLDPADVGDGFSRSLARFGSAESLGRRAQGQARAQMHRLNIGPIGLGAPPQAGGDLAGDACLITVLATVREGVAFPAGNQEEAALAALEHLAALSADKVEALYVSFTPGEGERLASPDVARMLALLRAARSPDTAPHAATHNHTYQ